MSIFFDFDVKFSHSLSPPSIKFETDDDVAVYRLKSIDEMEKWRSILKLRINQRGFHEQFKPLKKIGKGNFASVYLV